VSGVQTEAVRVEQRLLTSDAGSGARSHTHTQHLVVCVCVCVCVPDYIWSMSGLPAFLQGVATPLVV